MSAITRFSESQTVGVNTAIGTTEEMDYRGWAAGEVCMPAATDLTTLTWWAAEKPGGTYGAAYDSAGSAVTTTVQAARSYPIPVALLGAGAIKAVGNAAGTIYVSFKG